LEADEQTIPDHAGRIWQRRRVTWAGGSAVVGSFVRLESGVAEESEDPWLCDPGFRRVCLLSRQVTGAKKQISANGVKESRPIR
jgi:hypothetical protein